MRQKEASPTFYRNLFAGHLLTGMSQNAIPPNEYFILISSVVEVSLLKYLSRVEYLPFFWSRVE